MTMRTALLASAAVGALATAPAFAREHAPNIHLVAVAGARGTAVGTHAKSHVADAAITNYTATSTFNVAISTAADYKVKTEIVGEAWFSGSCTEPPTPIQHWKNLPHRTLYAAVSTGTVTSALANGACPGQTFKFYTVNYDLLTKKGAGNTDSFTGTLTALRFLKQYNLYLKSTFNVAIGS